MRANKTTKIPFAPISISFILALITLEISSFWGYQMHFHQLIAQTFEYDYHQKNWTLLPNHQTNPYISDTLKIDLSELEYQAWAKEWNQHYKNHYRITKEPWLTPKQKHRARIKQVSDPNARWKSAEISMMGMLSDHHGNFERMSLKVKLKGDNRLFQKKSFSLLLPETRMFFLDQLANHCFQKQYKGIRIQTKPVWVQFRKQKPVAMLLEDKFDKFLIESNRRRESIIFEKGFRGPLRDIPGMEQQHIDIFSNASLNDSSRQLEIERFASRLFNQPNQEVFTYIDHHKMMGVWAIGMLLQSWHHWVDINLHWYYNPVNHTFEPTLREVNLDTAWKLRGDLSQFNNRKRAYQNYVHRFQREIIQNRPNFLVSYMQWAETNIPHFWEKLDRECIQSSKTLLTLLPKYVNPQIPLLKQEGKNYHQYVRNLKEFALQVSQCKAVPINSTQTQTTVWIGNIKIYNTLEFPMSSTLKIMPGTRIEFCDTSALLILKGQVIAKGTKDQPIIMIADSAMRGSVFIESKQPITFEYVQFKGLSSLKQKVWQTPAAITLHKTNRAIFYHCEFANNQRGDDYLNLFDSKNFLINHCYFENVLSDAIDTDFSDGDINHTFFRNVGNDGIDGSGSRITISHCQFFDIHDKAVSSGEKSRISMSHSFIGNSEIGLVSKDLSTLNVSSTAMHKVRLPVAVFQKKPEYGAATLEIDDDLNQYKYLIQDGSQISHIGGEISQVEEVEELLYGNEYGNATSK
jgi:hypothetical protein